MSTWLKNNTLNCKWTLQIWFGKDSTIFNETVCLQCAWVSGQRTFRKITSKARPTLLLQRSCSGINLTEWNFFFQKKKMSKHVRNLTAVSSAMRISVRNKLWESMHLGIRQRKNKSLHTDSVFYFYPEWIPLMTFPLSSVSGQWTFLDKG